VSEPLIIVMEGGVIHSISTNDEYFNNPIIVVDLDIEGADLEDLTLVPFGDDSDMSVYAYVSEQDPFPHSNTLDEFAWDFLEGQVR